MEYLALIYADEAAWERFSDEEREAAYEQYGEFSRAARDAGVLVGGEELGPTASATTVRVRDGRQLVTDGPYAEAKEALGGYFILDCPSLDDALTWAARIPGASARRRRGPAGPRRRGGNEMKYALLVYSDQSSMGGDRRRGGGTAPGGVDAALDHALRGDGQGRSGRQGRKELVAATEAKVVRVVDGETIVTDGPFAETKEQIGGLFLTTLPDLDEAIRIASLVPAAEYGSLEVRPIVER